jgi:hypothetical protein
MVVWLGFDGSVKSGKEKVTSPVGRGRVMLERARVTVRCILVLDGGMLNEKMAKEWQAVGAGSAAVRRVQEAVRDCRILLKAYVLPTTTLVCELQVLVLKV